MKSNKEKVLVLIISMVTATIFLLFGSIAITFILNLLFNLKLKTVTVFIILFFEKNITAILKTILKRFTK